MIKQKLKVSWNSEAFQLYKDKAAFVSDHPHVDKETLDEAWDKHSKPEKAEKAK